MQVAWRPQPDRIFSKRVDDEVDVISRAAITIFSGQDRLYHVTGIIPGEVFGHPQSVEDQVWRAVVSFMQRRLVGGAADGQGAETLVEAQPRPVLLEYLLVGAERRVVG
jgi:hypothetical protein